MLQTVMQSQVLKAIDLSLIDSSFITLDATPVKANVSNNNPKSFKKISFLNPLLQKLIRIAGCERVFVRSDNSVKNLNTIAHISLLSIAIAAVITKKDVSYRNVKTLKRLA